MLFYSIFYLRSYLYMRDMYPYPPYPPFITIIINRKYIE